MSYGTISEFLLYIVKMLCLVQCLIGEWDKPLCAVARQWVEDLGTVVRLGQEQEAIIVSKPQGPTSGFIQPLIQ